MSVGHQLRASEPLRRPSVRSFDDVLLNQFVPINVKTAALARRNPGAEDKGTAYEFAIVEAASEQTPAHDELCCSARGVKDRLGGKGVGVATGGSSAWIAVYAERDTDIGDYPR